MLSMPVDISWKEKEEEAQAVYAMEWLRQTIELW